MVYMDNGVIWCYTHCCEQSIQFHDCMLRKRNVYDRLSEAARGYYDWCHTANFKGGDVLFNRGRWAINQAMGVCWLCQCNYQLSLTPTPTGRVLMD